LNKDIRVDEIPEYSTDDRMECSDNDREDRDVEIEREEFNERENSISNTME